MRVPIIKPAAALVLGGALLTSTACGDIGCSRIYEVVYDMDDFEESKKHDANGPLFSAADADYFRDAASKLRNAGGMVGGKVEAEANKVAADYEAAAIPLSKLSPGETDNAMRQESDYDLRDACGFAPGL